MKIVSNILLIILTLATTSLSAKKSNAITLEQIVETSSVSSTKVSPDGKHIAYTKTVPRDVYADEGGKSYVEMHVINKAGESKPFITGKQNVAGIAWGPKSQFIYFLAKRHTDDLVSIYKIAIDGGEAARVFKPKNNITAFTINRDGTKLTYLSKEAEKESKEKLEKLGFKAKVYEESKKLTHAYLVDLTIKDFPHLQLTIDDNILSVQYHPSNDKLLARVTPSPLIDDAYVSSQYRIYQQNGKLVKELKTEGKLGAARWSTDGKYVAIIGSENKHDPAAGRLFIAESRTGKITESLKNYPGHIKGLQWISDYQLAYLGHIGTKSEVSVLNLDSQSVTPKFDSGDQVITYIHADRAGKVLVGIASSDSHPRELINLSGKKSSRMTDTNPWLSKIVIPKQETISYKARDGVELQGVLIYPTDYKKRKRYPLIMMVHGGPESHISDAWLDRYSYPIKYAAANGFAVFLPNYRGSTGRGVAFSKMGQADYAGGEFNDLVDAITHLSNIGLVDKKRVGITGGSYGGYASAWAATALSEHFAASVMFVGISDQLSKFGTTDIPKEMHNVHARYYPWEKWQWMLERSPIYHTDKAKTPLLIMHGDSDTRVHPSQSMELYRYVKTRTNTPVRLVFYPGEGHGNRKNAAQLDYSMRLMRWMEFYLKGKKKVDKMPPYEIDHMQSVESKQ